MSDHMGLVPMSAEVTMFFHEFTSSLAFAAQQERDRIIKLLETEFEKGNEHICQNCDTWLEIKGEQK